MIPIADPDIGEAEKRAVLEAMDSGVLTDGPQVRAFEEEFAAFTGADHGVATTNGTTALHTALEALGVGPGDAVVTSPFSFVASANAVRLAGAEPVFADVDPGTYNLDPDAVEAVLREREDVVAVMPVHLYGLPAAVDHFHELAERYDLAVVEDAAQAHGATVDGRRVGTFGDVACFSFYPTKNMTTGEGGMVLTDRDDVAERARRFIDHGRSSGYEFATVGTNYRMMNLAGAIGRVQLEKLPEYNEARRANAARLTEGLADVESVETPVAPADRRHVYHQYTVRAADRDGLKRHLEERGVGSKVYYPLPIHRQEAYAGVAADAPEAERAAGEVLSLPVHPGVSEAEVGTIVDAVRTYGGSA